MEKSIIQKERKERKRRWMEEGRKEEDREENKKEKRSVPEHSKIFMTSVKLVLYYKAW